MKRSTQHSHLNSRKDDSLDVQAASCLTMILEYVLFQVTILIYLFFLTLELDRRGEGFDGVGVGVRAASDFADDEWGLTGVAAGNHGTSNEVLFT